MLHDVAAICWDKLEHRNLGQKMPKVLGPLGQLRSANLPSTFSTVERLELELTYRLVGIRTFDRQLGVSLATHHAEERLV